MILPLFLAFAALAGGPPANDPLAPARSGKLQCHEPDPVNRRCLVLARYEFGMDGGIVNVAETMLMEEPLIVFTTRTPITVRDGEVCGDRKDSKIVRMTIDGQPARPEEIAEVTAAMTTALKDQFGKQSCSRYRPAGDVLIGESSVGGVRQPEFDRRVLWVDPDSGWSVVPQLGT